MKFHNLGRLQKAPEFFLTRDAMSLSRDDRRSFLRKATLQSSIYRHIRKASANPSQRVRMACRPNMRKTCNAANHLDSRAWARQV